jgi:membrane-associated protease RseP (regulator of RpoE activity)
MSIWWWLLFLLAGIWGTILLLNRFLKLKKHGFNISPGILMWRTKRGVQGIDRIARSSKRTWVAFGTAAAVVGTILMIFVFINFVLNAWFVLQRPEAGVAGATLVLPGFMPGLTVHMWLIAIAVLLVVHELAHGLVARAQKLKIKSVGALLALIIPGGFVEIDEKEMEKAPVGKRLRVLGAGSFSNILVGMACLGIMLLALTPKPGVYITGVAENTPAENYLTSGMRLMEVDTSTFQYQINNWIDFYEAMENVEPGENLRITTDNGTFSITLAARSDNENRGYLGISTYSSTAPIDVWGIEHNLFGVEYSSSSRVFWMDPLTTSTLVIMSDLRGYPLFHPSCYDSLFPWTVIDLLKWLFFLNFGIGLFNLLPMIPLDGGAMLKGLVEKVSSKRTASRVAKGVSILTLALLIVNFLPMVL